MKNEIYRQKTDATLEILSRIESEIIPTLREGSANNWLEAIALYRDNDIDPSAPGAYIAILSDEFAKLRDGLDSGSFSRHWVFDFAQAVKNCT